MYNHSMYYYYAKSFLICSHADNGIWKKKQQLLCTKQHIL